MIAHSMKYVAMCEAMAKEHPERATEFRAAARRIFEAEQATVAAYLSFKGLLRDVDSTLAAELIEKTYWDLT